MTRVLFLCNDALGENMAGPGIRYWELARTLGKAGLEVTLAVLPIAPDPTVCNTQDFPARIHRCMDDADVRVLVRATDVVIAQGTILAPYPFLTHLSVPLVLDEYIFFLLERLNIDTDTVGGDHLFSHESYRRVFNAQIRAGDFFLCASEKQRDFWLGAMSAGGRVNPYTHGEDPTLRRLIDVVPFGLSGEPPRHTRQVMKGVHPGIAASDRVLLWGGGIWKWFDAPTLIRAMARLADGRPDIKLFFMGIQRPNNQSAKIQAAADQAIALSQELGLYGRTIFSNEWVAYEERGNYLLEADVGVSLHPDHLETRFSFRTRFLDYVWAGLPMVMTRGDVLSEQVESQGLGRVVAPGDVEGVAEAILHLLETPNLRETFRPHFEPIAARYRWEVVTRPLVEFCASPRLAPDKGYLRELAVFEVGPTPWWRLPGKAWRALRLGGVRRLARQMDEYRRWLLNRWD
jgi:glycosyltransferase involved in cell wall biosynthesis